VASEIALLRVRYSHFNPDLVEYFEKHPGLERLMVDPDRIVLSVRLALTLCLLGYGTLSVWLGVQLARLAVPTSWGLPLEFWVALTVVGGGLVFYLLADLIARGIGVSFPKAVLWWGRWPLVIVAILLRPVLWPLRVIAGWILRPLGVRDPRPLGPLELETQLELMGEHEKGLPLAVQTILRNSIQLRDLVVSDVLLPRNQVQFFDLFAAPADNLRLAREAGHTRYPLCEGDLDRCIGLIHVKDLFRKNVPLEKLDFRRLKRKIIRVDAEEPLEQALSKLLAHNMHMALVIDEFRGVEGLLTLEKILEQLVGDIRDEFDADESALIRETPSEDKELMVDGLTPLHELEVHFGVDLSNDEVSTVSGLITLELGRIPLEGEIAEVSGMRLEATKVDDTRVLEARVSPVPVEAAGNEPSSDPDAEV
jgi:CBS domain containing-hemolysin-like protein